MLKSLALSAALALCFAANAEAATITYVASLSGPAEAPPNASPGIGIVTVDFNDLTSEMTINADFSGLLGNTTAAHIHCCTEVPLTGFASVATETPSFVGFPLGVTAGTYSNTFDMTQALNFRAGFITGNGGTVASALAALLNGLNDGKAYFNIHTDFFPGGEIRGFLAPVPLPAALPLLAAGLGAMGFMGWRRKRKALA